MLESLREGRIGRMPIWVVGVVLAGAIILFVVVRKRFAKSGGDAPSSFDESGVSTDSVEGIPAESFADQLSGRFPQNVSVTSPPSRPSTNAQWLIAAFDYLVGMGKDPSMAQRALQNYLSGKTLTDAEWVLINAATANPALSLPPEGVVLPVPTTGTTTTPTPTPTGTIPATVQAPSDTDLYVWTDQLNGSYAGLNTTFTKLFGNFKGDPTALNPTARNYMTWSDGPGYKIPKFNGRQPAIRIR